MTDAEEFNKLVSSLTEILSIDEIKGLIFDEDCEGQFRDFRLMIYFKGNCFQYAVRFMDTSIIKSLSESIKTILTLEDQKKLFGNRNIFHLAVPNWQSKIFSTIYECLNGVFTNDEIKHQMEEKDYNGCNTFLALCNHKSPFYLIADVLKGFFEVLKDIFNFDELKDCLRSTNNDGSNCLLLAITCKDVPFLTELIRIIQTELSIDDQRTLIEKYDNNSKNILICASQNYCTGILPLILDFARKVLSNEQVMKLLNQTEGTTDCLNLSSSSEILSESES